MTDSKLHIGFLGGGNMASAIIAGIADRLCPADQIHVVEPAQALHAGLQQRGVQVSTHPDAGFLNTQVWVLAVKPQHMREAITPLAHSFAARQPLVMSVAAGLTIASLARWFGTTESSATIVRCMPNTPALIGAGVSGLYAPSTLPQAQRSLCTSIMESVGQVVWVDSEVQIDAVTALSGSGPAYVFRFLEALITTGNRMGLDAEQSRTLALATLQGAAKLAAESSETPATLRERVTSKGGTTAAALNVLEQAGWANILQDAVQAAQTRSAELSKEFGA